MKIRGSVERRWFMQADCRRDDDCWPWEGAKNPSGHGRLQSAVRGRSVPAHRVAYELFVGPIPDGLHLDHLCRNPGCVNPKHLEPVSLWENLRRCPNTPAVRNAAKTHCPQGHEYSDESTYRYGNRRVCKTCVNGGRK